MTNTGCNAPLGSVAHRKDLVAAQRLSERAKLLDLCGAIHPLTHHVCNMPADHDENHAARRLSGHGDPTGEPYATWARLVAL